MKRSVLSASMLMLVASQAAALSCMRPDVARSFNFAAEADESYSVFMGTFEYEQVQRPRGGDIFNPEGYDIPARFTGQGLGADGFGAIEPVNVTISVQCSASWCGGPPPLQTQTLAFVERTSAGYVLKADACNSSYFSPVLVEDLDRVESCMRGTGCEDLQR